MASLGALLAFVGLSVVGMPMVWALLLSSAVALWLLPGIPVAVVADQVLTGFDSFVLVAIPLFMFAGEILRFGGVIDALIGTLLTVSKRPARTLPLVNVGSSTLLSGINGSALADVSAIGSVLIPMMERAGYSKAFASALTAASSVVGPIIPPSIVFIYYGSVTGVPVGQLFLAGLVPGLTVSLLLALYAMSWGLRGHRGPISEGARAVGRPSIKALAQLAFYASGLPIIALGIGLGVVSPVEAAAVAVVFAISSVLVTRPKAVIVACFQGALSVGRNSADVLLLIGFSRVLAWLIVVDGGAAMLTGVLLHLTESKWVIWLVLNLTLLVLGAFLDTFPAIAVIVPILGPIATSFSIHPLHLGVVVVVNLMIGGITPPIGGCLFLSSKIAGVPFSDSIRAVAPMLGLLLVALALITYLPDLSLFLPSLLSQ